MNTDIELLDEVVNKTKRLIKAHKDVERKSEKYQSMSLENTTPKARASASDRLTDACFDRDRAKDELHAALVDAGLTPLKDIEYYEPREITQNAGFGHSIKLQYHPAKPECLK